MADEVIHSDGVAGAASALPEGFQLRQPPAFIQASSAAWSVICCPSVPGAVSPRLSPYQTISRSPAALLLYFQKT